MPVRNSEADLAEIEAARSLLMKHGMRDNLAYWILVHAHNRLELDKDELWLRVARSSRNAVRKIREIRC